MRPTAVLVCLVTLACGRHDRVARDTSAARDTAAGAQAAAPLPDTLWLFPRPGERALIDGTTTEADLIRRFGAAQVRRDSINTIETEMIAGTILFPDDSTRRLEIIWGDTVAYARASWARAWGTGNRWTIAPGVRVGTPMAEIERLNGKPFTFSGFDWDYGGDVQSYDGGRLDAIWSADTIHASAEFTLPEGASLSDAEMKQVIGDQTVRSDNPIVRKVRPVVSSVSVSWDRPKGAGGAK